MSRFLAGLDVGVLGAEQLDGWIYFAEMHSGEWNWDCNGLAGVTPLDNEGVEGNESRGVGTLDEKLSGKSLPHRIHLRCANVRKPSPPETAVRMLGEV